MLSEFITFITDGDLIGPEGRTLLAVSGGADSVVMADLFHRAEFPFDIAHANFQLRGGESGRDEYFVRKLADKYNVRMFVKHFDTVKFARKNKVSIQVAARMLRYDWFDELIKADAYNQVATAHHLDDQVETFLINLTRGTGISGLHGISSRQGNVIRPMLFAGRKEIEAYAFENDIGFINDSSNLSMKYSRNRIRHKVIPQLEKINPEFRHEITQTILFIRDAETIYRQSIDQIRKELFHEEGDVIYIPAEQFFLLKPLTSWAYELLSPFGFNLSNIRDITGLADSIPGKEVRSATHRVIKDRDRLIIAPCENPISDETHLILMNDLERGRVQFPMHIEFEILTEVPQNYGAPDRTAHIDLDKLDFPLIIRKWHRGDFFYPMGMSKRKKLSDFFTDQKFSRIEKENQWLICSGDSIVWIVGHRIDDRFKITSSARKILKISLPSNL